MVNSKKSGNDVRDDDEVYMDRHMGFLRATGVVVNSVVGTGIFLSPTGIAGTVGSVGATLLIWLLCGVLIMLQGLVYTELGTMMPKAGGSYAFILECFGPMVAFSTVWASIISNPSSFVVMGRVTAQYLLRFAFPHCPVPYVIQQLVVPVVVLFIAFLNCRSIYLASRIQTVFSVGKILALLTISVTGIVMIAHGRTGNFAPSTAFENTRADAGSLAVAVLFGFHSFAGWEALFGVQEEVKKPERTLPLVCISSLSVITAVYILTNVAYFTAMNVEELVASPGVALTFGERSLGSAHWLIPIFVCMSTLGYIIAYAISASRLVFSISRQGSLPQVLSMLHVKQHSPIPAVIFLMVVAACYMLVHDIYNIISFATFVGQSSNILAVACWFYLRWKRPNAKRTFKVPLIVPLLAIIVLIALLILAFARAPAVYGTGVIVYFSSYVVYLLHKYLLSRSDQVKIPMNAITAFLQRVLMVVPEKRSHVDTILQDEKEL